MAINQAFIAELKHEAQSTRKILERVPAEHFDWKPHERSGKLQWLAAHIANLPAWVLYTVNQDELDLTAYPKRELATTTEALVKEHDENIEKAVQALNEATDELLMKPWKLKKGDHVIFELPKVVVLRNMVFNHIVHHRGQLSVYLRLLDVPVPGMYGPSADDVIAMAAQN